MLEVVQLLLLLVRLFSAMNILPNSNFEIWNNAYNSANNSYNSFKICKGQRFWSFSWLYSRVQSFLYQIGSLYIALQCALQIRSHPNSQQSSKIMRIIVKIMQIIVQQKQNYFTCRVPAHLLGESRCACCPPGQ